MYRYFCIIVTAGNSLGSSYESRCNIYTYKLTQTKYVNQKSVTIYVERFVTHDSRAFTSFARNRTKRTDAIRSYPNSFVFIRALMGLWRSYNHFLINSNFNIFINFNLICFQLPKFKTLFSVFFYRFFSLIFLFWTISLISEIDKSL